jgi:hypothetical protein
MKTLKFINAFAITVFFLLAISSCKKDKESVSSNAVTKDQLLGKWNMVTVLPGGTVEKDQITLKTNGTMEMDIEPKDGIVDFILSWDVKDNVFTAHWDFNGVSNVWTLNAQVNPKTLLITGEKTMTNGGNSTTLIFGMEKQ